MAIELADLRLFATVARHSSLNLAANELGISASAVSHALKATEARLGVRLFNRTTRSVALTQAGARLLEDVTPALASIASALEGVNAFRDTPQGLLRINAPRPAGELVLPRLIAAFLRANPKVEVELVLDDALVDIVAQGFDAGVRFGESVQRDMVAIPLGGTQRFVVVATPALVQAVGAPVDPRELVNLPCICLQFPSRIRYAWEFEKGADQLQVHVNGQLTTSEMHVMLHAAQEGVGFAYVYAQYARDALRSGQLITVLDDWCPPIPGFYLYYPSRKQAPATLRAFVETVRESSSALTKP